MMSVHGASHSSARASLSLSQIWFFIIDISIIIIITKVKGGGVPEHLRPFRRVQIRQCLERSDDSGKPVIEDDIELTVDVATVQI